MGIGPEPQKLLRELNLPKGFSVCELGSQIAHNGSRRDPNWTSRPAREFYAEIGCGRYESIDANGEATITADLNAPLEPFPGQFALATDFGTLEHVANVLQGWTTLHQLCEPGGLIVGDKPTRLYRNHGFWLHDKCFFDAVVKANRYTVLHFSEAHARRGTCYRFVFRKPSEGDTSWKMPRQSKWRFVVGK